MQTWAKSHISVTIILPNSFQIQKYSKRYERPFFRLIDSYLDKVQDLNARSIHLDQVLLLPSRVTKQLEELALFLGRVSCLPSSYTRTSPLSVGTSLRLSTGNHLFHLHLELNWAAIETLCLLLEKQGKYMIY